LNEANGTKQFSTNIRLAKCRYFFVRNCWDYSRFGTYIALIRNDISCALSDRINRYSIQRTSIVRTLSAQTRLTARRGGSPDTPYFIIIGLDPLKLFTPSTMVTRGALKEVQLHRGIIPHVGLHYAPPFLAMRCSAPKDCDYANKVVAKFTVRTEDRCGVRERLIPVRHVNVHNAN